MSDENEVVKCVVIRETEKAYLMRDSDAPERESWFPKSQVSFRQRNVKTGVATAEIPLWLLDKNGWNQ